MRKNLISLSDQQLVALYRNGDSDAFGVLVEKYSQRVSNSLFHVLKDSLLVEEILQDTFIKAMEALNRTDIVGYTDQSNFCAWLVQIGHNLSVDYFRKAKRKREYAMSNKDSDEAFDHIPGESRNPEQLITDIETEYDIQVLIDQLHPDQKEVLVLYYFNGMRFREIVDYIGGGVSINTCLGRMRYALINLRKIIDQIKAEGQKVL